MAHDLLFNKNKKGIMKSRTHAVERAWSTALAYASFAVFLFVEVAILYRVYLFLRVL